MLKAPAIVLFCTTLLLSTQLFGKDLVTKRGYRLPLNEVNIYYGLGTMASSGGATPNSSTIISIHDLNAARHEVGCFGVEYFRRLCRPVSVGMAVNYEPYYETDFKPGRECPIQSVSPERVCEHALSPMLEVKFHWFNFPNVSMYSKAAIGVEFYMTSSYRISGVSYSDHAFDQRVAFALSDYELAWEVCPIGIDFGSPKYKGFVELAVPLLGTQGSILFGVRYCF